MKLSDRLGRVCFRLHIWSPFPRIGSLIALHAQVHVAHECHRLHRGSREVSVRQTCTRSVHWNRDNGLLRGPARPRLQVDSGVRYCILQRRQLRRGKASPRQESEVRALTRTLAARAPHSISRGLVWTVLSVLLNLLWRLPREREGLSRPALSPWTKAVAGFCDWSKGRLPLCPCGPGRLRRCLLLCCPILTLSSLARR